MKKILSLTLAALMVVSMIPTAFAAENETDYSNGTEITYIGSQEEAAGGAGNVWTVTVPAKMVPGDTSTVKAEGTWSSKYALSVRTSDSVELTYGAQSMDVAVTFGSIREAGNDKVAKAVSTSIAVADASRLFGTWDGLIEYNVELVLDGDANNDGVVNEDDYQYVLDIVSQKITLTDEEEAGVILRVSSRNKGYLDATDAARVMQIVNYYA